MRISIYLIYAVMTGFLSYTSIHAVTTEDHEDQGQKPRQSWKKVQEEWRNKSPEELDETKEMLEGMFGIDFAGAILSHIQNQINQNDNKQ